jgi:hypothetical protein
MTSVFISYRREDSAPYAGRLCDRLGSTLGNDRVFMDLQDIHPGQDFARAIDETVSGCAVLIAVIGPRWLTLLQQRAQAAEDFVRSELSAALSRKIAVIPVLVGGATMPAPADLPDDLVGLSRSQALEIRDTRFEDDYARLTEAISLLARPLDLNGTWIAEMEKERVGRYKLRLNLIVSRNRIHGTVDYPTGHATIRDGRIDGSVIEFSTSHVPQFESQPAIIHFYGEVTNDTIRLVTTDDYSVASGIARRGPAVQV